MGRIFNRQPLIRIVSLSLGVGTAILLVAKLAMPQLSLAWLAFLLTASLLGMLLFMYGSFAMVALGASVFPGPRVSIRADKIRGHDGSCKFFLERDDLVSAFIYVHPDGKIRLKLRDRRYRRNRVIVVGVPSDVDLSALADLLAVKLTFRSVGRRH